MLTKREFGYVIYSFEKGVKQFYTAYEADEKTIWSCDEKRAFIFTDLAVAARVASSLEDAEIRCLYKTEELNQFRGEDGGD